MQINPKSPIQYSASIEIKAPVDVVWSVMTDIEQWPSWNTDIKYAKLHGPLCNGTEFVWKSGPGTIRSTIGEIIPQKKMGWTGTTMGIRATHIWRLQPSKKGTLVTTEEAWDGVVARLFKPLSLRTLQGAVSSGLSMLKDCAESHKDVK